MTVANNPSAMISQLLLKGANYDEWAHGMKYALNWQNKFEFLDSFIIRRDKESSDLEDSWTMKALLISWIKMMIDHSL